MMSSAKRELLFVTSYCGKCSQIIVGYLKIYCIKFYINYYIIMIDVGIISIPYISLATISKG